MPNIEILGELDCSPLLAAIQASNEKKIERETYPQAAEGEKENTLATATKE